MIVEAERVKFETLKQMLDAMARGDEAVPEFLNESRWWKAYKELYDELGENCVLLNKVALGFYLNERSLVSLIV